MGLLHLRRRRHRVSRGADETWPEIPISVPVLCIRQLLLLGITLWAARQLPLSSLHREALQPAIRQFLIRFLPPTLLLHLVAACYGSIYQPAIGEQSLRGAAAARALAIAVALPVGIVLFSWAAIMFGVSFLRDSKSTLHWALLMSALTAAPAAAVAGGSGVRWRRIFLLFKANGEDELSVAAASYGAMIGTWFGAWPLPLDWGTQWQEWPNACAITAIVGYMIGLLASIVMAMQQQRPQAKLYARPAL